MNAHPSQEILGVCRRSYLQDPPHSVGLSSIFTPIQYELDTGVLQGHVGGFDWIGLTTAPFNNHLSEFTKGAGYDFAGWGCLRPKFQQHFNRGTLSPAALDRNNDVLFQGANKGKLMRAGAVVARTWGVPQHPACVYVCGVSVPRKHDRELMEKGGIKRVSVSDFFRGPATQGPSGVHISKPSVWGGVGVGPQKASSFWITMQGKARQDMWAQ
ncbi:hypothetical protein BGY98DRAFT_933473 [Russula aff. rugulosa BPL654]|nr:hypothetical protein BGY98DRAFT_933473 [Russula aff. rugulosa BPL654]